MVVLLAGESGPCSGLAQRAALPAINNAALLAVVGVVNLWAQSGLRARDVAILAGALTIYDVVFTTQLPLMADLFHHLRRPPVRPVGELADRRRRGPVEHRPGRPPPRAVSPLVLRKAFGKAAGPVAMATTGRNRGHAGAGRPGPGTVELPADGRLGPLIIVQYVYWTRRRGRERTTRQYLQAEPMRGQVASAK